MKNIKIIALSFILVFLTQSCVQQSKQPPNNNLVIIKKATAQNTIIETLKERFKYNFQFNNQVTLTDKAYFISKHEKEILKTLQITEKDSIPNKKFILVFYLYSVGSTIVRETAYMKKMDGNWYIHPAYYSSYDDDPFKNGEGKKGKALLKKKDKWEDSNKNIWWK